MTIIFRWYNNPRVISIERSLDAYIILFRNHDYFIQHSCLLTKETELLQSWVSVNCICGCYRRLTHLPLVPHLRFSELGQHCFSISRRQVVTWINDVLFSTGPLGTNFSRIGIKILNFSLMKMHLDLSSAKWRSFCPGGIWVNSFPPAWLCYFQDQRNTDYM